MDHDRSVCPRCGNPAGENRFCEPCRSHLESLTGIPTLHAGDSIHRAAHAPQELRRSEQAWTATAHGDGDAPPTETHAAGVQVDPDPRPAEPPSSDAGPLAFVKEAAAPTPEVARLEDVLTIKPAERPVEIAPEPGAVEEVKPPANEEEPECDWVRLRREVARLEQAMTQLSGSETVAAPAEKAEPTYVAAQALREAFWFEQASAFRSKRDVEATSVPPPQPVASVPPPQILTSVPPPPAATSVPPPQPAPAVEPNAEPTESRFLIRLWGVDTTPRHWAVAACLLALLGVVKVLRARRAETRHARAQAF